MAKSKKKKALKFCFKTGFWFSEKERPDLFRKGSTSASGVRLLDQNTGVFLLVADDHPFLSEGFETTEICYAWNDYLRRLPGAHRATKPMMIDGKMRRGVMVPMNGANGV